MRPIHSYIDKPHRISRKRCRSGSCRSGRGKVQQIQKELLPCPGRPISRFIQKFRLWIRLNLCCICWNTQFSPPLPLRFAETITAFTGSVTTTSNTLSLACPKRLQIARF